MTKTLTKHGNSYALVIDKALLEVLKIEPDTPLEIVTNGDGLFIFPVRKTAHKRKIRESLAEIDKKYGSVFERLSNA